MPSLKSMDQSEMIQEVIRRLDEDNFSKNDNGAIELDIGSRLHEIRKSRELTLQEAARITGVSASAFSKIERNELSPTISTMQRIALGLEVELTSLLSGQDTTVTAYGRRSVTRKDAGSAHSTMTCNNTLLCSDIRNKRITPIITTVIARKPDDYSTWAKSDAEIFLIVLEGSLIVHSRIYEPLTLNEGDSLYYDANTEHVWTSEGSKDAKILWVLTVN